MKQRKCITVLRNDLTENLTHFLELFQCTFCHPLHMADCPKACATPTNSNARVSSKVIEMHMRHTLRIHTRTWCTYLQCMQSTLIHVLKPAHISRFPMNTQSGCVSGILDLNNQSLGQRLHKYIWIFVHHWRHSLQDLVKSIFSGVLPEGFLVLKHCA